MSKPPSLNQKNTTVFLIYAAIVSRLLQSINMIYVNQRRIQSFVFNAIYPERCSLPALLQLVTEIEPASADWSGRVRKFGKHRSLQAVGDAVGALNEIIRGLGGWGRVI